MTAGSHDELMDRFTEQLTSPDRGQPQGLSRQAFAAGAARVSPARRPRRDRIATYRVRVDLDGTRPPLWRRLELASDLSLAEVHDVLQIAFGWTDSHLHRFASGGEHFLSPFDVEEGDGGVPEAEVRLDEVLAEVGDRLTYTYDFGDGWEHILHLEAVLDRVESARRSECTDGRRPGPPEDCGGVPGYELLVAATDPSHADHRAAVAEYRDAFGDDADPAHYAPTPFDLGEINESLVALASPAVDVPGAVRELLDATLTAGGKRRLRQLIDDAALDRPVVVDTATAAQMVRSYTWLLERVGVDGIRLTGAGYLPPAEVEAALAALDVDGDWIGKGNREVQTLPVLDLRESAQRAGLLRKYRGKLLLTRLGKRVATDPVALWWVLAETTPPRSDQKWQRQAGLILLLLTAARRPAGLDATVAELLGAIGWTTGEGTPLTRMMAAEASWTTKALLRRLCGSTSAAGMPEHASEQGALFARAALTTWP